MADIDPQLEWDRICEQYSRLSDEELLQIARDGNELTEIASQAISAELKIRGLSIPNEKSRQSLQVSELPQELVEVARFRSPVEGGLAKAAIESAGIEAFLFDGAMSKYVALGVRVYVRPPDAEAAKEILSQPIPESFEVEGVGTYEQPRCPKCGSLDISFGWSVFNDTVHDVANNEQWSCQSCGATWQADDTETVIK